MQTLSPRSSTVLSHMSRSLRVSSRASSTKSKQQHLAALARAMLRDSAETEPPVDPISKMPPTLQRIRMSKISKSQPPVSPQERTQPESTTKSRPSLQSIAMSKHLKSKTPQRITPAPRYATGENEESIDFSLKLLLPPNGQWELTASGEGIQRVIRFKTFKKAWDFMDRISVECKAAKHHPEWANTYNTVFVRWTTHSPKGLTEDDVMLAEVCDEHAKSVGEVYEDGHEPRPSVLEEGEQLQQMIKALNEEAPDSCVPKKK